MRTAGYTWYESVNAGRSNATVTDSVPSLPGATGVDDLIANAAPELLSVPDGTVEFVLMNWGVNEMTVGDAVEDLPSAVEWEGNYQSILSYVNGLWPSAKVFLSYPWRADYVNQPAELHTRIDSLITWCGTQGISAFAGVDEAVVIQGEDNGCVETENCSGVHYSLLGNQLYAADIQDKMGL